jgi:hypothetical protein
MTISELFALRLSYADDNQFADVRERAAGPIKRLFGLDGEVIRIFLAFIGLRRKAQKLPSQVALAPDQALLSSISVIGGKVLVL